MKKFDEFTLALANLKEIYKYEEPYDTVVFAGIVALYGHCYELAWETMQEVLEYNGVSDIKTSSPRVVLRTASKRGLIRDEELWQSALQARNNTTYLNDEAVMLDVARSAKLFYWQMFCDLKNEIERNWL